MWVSKYPPLAAGTLTKIEKKKEKCWDKLNGREAQKNPKWISMKGRENEKVNNSAIILGKGTAEVQCNGLWLCPLQKHHMDQPEGYESN